MKRDIKRWVQTCLSCQRNKVHRHIRLAPPAFPLLSSRFDHIHIDLVGPLPLARGFRYILTIVDRYTRWPEAVPITDATTPTIAQALISAWISRFGVPSVITTDRGPQFESAFFTNLMRILGTKRSRTTAYHPASNGLVERLHRQLKVALRAAQHTPWPEALPLVLLGIRASFKPDLGCTTRDLVYGAPLRLPADLLQASPTLPLLAPADYLSRLRHTMDALRPTTPRSSRVSNAFQHTDLDRCSHVFVRYDGVKKPLQPLYSGPYPVIRRTPAYFMLLVNGREDTVSLHRLKPAFIDASTLPAVASLGPPPASHQSAW
ncbi:protein NYNRIN-like [Ornithodoros turicata]|uniref:protein NYNRIN-like n=1 Tax=Ornithodoros turicata TaxID=34597 RepID=UPI00313A25D1